MNSTARLGVARLDDRTGDAIVINTLPTGFHIGGRRANARVIDVDAKLGSAVGGRIFEQSRVTGINLRPTRREVRAANGLTRANHVVIACGGYIGWLFCAISAATVPVATFVMVSELLGDRLKNSIQVPYAVSDIQTPTNYYRPLADGRLMWGERVLTWQPGAGRLARGLRRDMVSFYPNLVDARRSRLGRANGISSAPSPGHWTSWRRRMVRSWLRRAPGVGATGQDQTLSRTDCNGLRRRPSLLAMRAELQHP